MRQKGLSASKIEYLVAELETILVFSFCNIAEFDPVCFFLAQGVDFDLEDHLEPLSKK